MGSAIHAVNEIRIGAPFSAQFGWWNERLSSDQAFVTALKHLCRANEMAEHLILDVQPEATFVQSEATEYFHAEDPECIDIAEFYNEKRFLALDLTYGYPVNSTMYEYLMDNGMTREEYHWFGNNHVKAISIMGNDYYITNEHNVHADGSTSAAGEVWISRDHEAVLRSLSFAGDAHGDKPHGCRTRAGFRARTKDYFALSVLS